MTKVLLLVIFLIGLIAQFVKPVGDALEGKAYLGGALLSLVGYVLYTEVQRLNTAHGVQRGDTDSLGATLRHLTEEVGHLNAERLSGRAALVTPRDLEEEFKKALQVGGDVRFSAMGFTGETFAKALDQIFEQSSQNDQRVVHVKVLVPDFTKPIEVPGLIGADGKSIDAPVFRRSLVRQIEGYDALLKRQIGRMRHKHQGVLTVEFRVMHMSPSLKLYLINNDQVFEGIYDKIALRPGEYDAAVPAEEASGAAEGEILDLLGYDSLLTRWSADDDERARDVVVRRRKFFDTLWEAAHELSVVSARDGAQAS
ncbi:ATP/GTP-binding protein [Streptomyces mirabilis]|uniref:ATP/GTP-binding protein n=1 Tax=Streptomyces mirabilis TaxID=68239 RepID=UPI00339F193F